ncbi:MAG: alanine racemase [Bacteroidetes bacterium]|nr:MAG: alanine racemase [Bacteroidota bacterium]
MAPTVAAINLAHLRHNVRLLRERAGPADLMGVVKANAYGHGAVPVARVLREEGVRHFAVATVAEGRALRQAGVEDPILVFGGLLPVGLAACARLGLDVTITSAEVAEAAMHTARTVAPLRVHVEVDTGMGRTGLAPDEVPAVLHRLERAPGITVAGLYTHFATVGDAFVAEQAARFAAVVDALGGAAPPLHTGNSGVLLSPPAFFSLEGTAFVRAGVALYGIYESPDGASPLRPVMTLRSHITQIKTVPAGTTVSYGRTWRAPRRTRIATVACGYADGYPRRLSNRAEAGLHGRRVPVVGTICMDMLMLDLGPDGPEARPGDPVILFGEGGPSAAEVARQAETITYELCCGIAPRVPRHYVDIAPPPAQSE